LDKKELYFFSDVDALVVGEYWRISADCNGHSGRLEGEICLLRTVTATVAA
jgi:hypothetical protein